MYVSRPLLLLIILITVVFSCSLPEINDEVNQVSASFSADSIENSGYAPARVFFTNTSAFADEYVWDFGDPSSGNNNSSTELNPSHTFNFPGVYSVKLIAKNSRSGEENTFNTNISILEVKTFIKTFNEGGDDYGFSITITQNGGIAVIGSSNKGGDFDPYLIITDDGGNPISGTPKTIDLGLGAGDEEGNSIITTSSGGLAYMGYNYNTPNLDIFLIIADGNGNKLSGFPKWFDGGKNDFAGAITETDNGNLLIATSSENSSGESDIWMILTSSSGVTQSGFPRRFNNDIDYGGTPVQTPNGFAILGSTYNGSNFDLWLILTDPIGNELPGSGKAYDGGSGDDFGNAIIVTKSGNLAMIGKSKYGPDFYPLLIITDLNGNPLPGFPKRFDDIFGNGDLSIAETKEGDLILAGSVNNGINTDVWLMKTDKDGNPRSGFPKQFAHGFGDDFSSSIIATPDGGFAIVGQSHNGTNYDLLLIKTDSEGNVN